MQQLSFLPGEKPAKQRVMFRGILITQDNADKVQDFNIKS